uniref:RRM domain-containing protein n=1 Tax=Sphaeramia orbicularis TaxID=375764 RepID=A0A672YHC8_9TELE
MEEKTTPKRRVCISLPRKHMAALEEKYELDHGLFIKELNPCLSEGYVRAYFREWGTVTSCKIRRSSNSGETKAVVYVMFSTEDEANSADWAGPHFIGGSKVEIRRVVSLKVRINQNAVFLLS